VRRINKSIIGGLLGGMLVLHGLLFWNEWHSARQGYFDFTVFYTAGTIVRLGLSHGLYDRTLQYQVQHSFASEVQIRKGPLPYIHPPFEALLFVPLSVLNYPAAYVVWDLLNLAMLALLFLLLRPHIPVLETTPLWLWLAIWLAFFPVFGCLLQGQDSILLLLLCALGFRALKRNADFLAGCWFALGTLKFQFMIPLVLLLVLWKRRRVGAGFLAVSFVLTLLSAGLVGWQGLLQYPVFVRWLVRGHGIGEVPPELMPNLRGLIEGWALPIPHALVNTLVITATVALFVFAWWSGRGFPPQNFNLQFSLATIIAVLIAWHTNGHDLSLLVLPVTLLADHIRSLQADARKRKRVLLIPLEAIFISPLWFVLWLVIGKVNLMSIPLLWWAWEVGKEILRLDCSPRTQTGDQLVFSS
jgi:hypothetical protein